ncbi:uncharacterized protein LOC122388083 [Amphibalanus amphitrite]|uniref:uncharacterized protein LOC122388083 n=1 Tax=Amphibalanus amphitrite TaxID=1232801 RepID=UPI001C927419|nr:uncharacterized protein LOC122388083 [Amphibalanus amphitrite]
MVLPRLLVIAAVLALCLPAGRAAELWRRPVLPEPPSEDSAAASSDPSASSAQQVSQALSRTSAALAQQFLRSSRAVSGMHQQPYDVPLIECPPASDGMERFACPTADYHGRYRCIDDHMLCNGYRDCPGSEDEDRKNCMFYKTTKTHLNVLADALLRWARGR